MDFSAWFLVVIVPVLIASVTVLYYFAGKKRV